MCLQNTRSPAASCTVPNPLPLFQGLPDPSAAMWTTCSCPFFMMSTEIHEWALEERMWKKNRTLLKGKPTNKSS
jgi:hypothetical protein